MTRDGMWAVAIFAGALLVYNANGREIGSFDSQPTKLAARELLVHRTLSLNYAVGAAPLLLERSGFVLANDGRYRSAYSPVPAILAAAIFWPAYRLGLVDVRAPLGASLLAAVSASLLTALAVVFAFLSARQYLGTGRALVLAAALGLGTGLWSTVSQTLWEHETVAFGLAMAMYAFAQPNDALTTGRALVVAIGLGLAVTARPQLAPLVAVLIAGAAALGGWRRGLLVAGIVALFAGALMLAYLRWFGTVLGAAPMLEALHRSVHATADGSFRWQPLGFAGLLVSPSRGLLVFSPIVAVAALGLPAAASGGRRSPLRWCAIAAAVQYAVYASYVVWWGGHTYGPRYLLDLLPVLVPLAAHGASRLHGRVAAALVGTAIAWSVAVAALGAFCYPNGQWNVDPLDVDRAHQRLWDWSDNEIARCWEAGPSPQNFSLFRRAAFRRDVP